ncbi:MAG TPA: YdbH domain-containing protein [Kofleriaceae bacterium]|nr:YdbH domain-containing protein [Kofleriaceae bacterium]
MALVAGGLVMLHRALPGLIARRVERLLADRGFAGAHVSVSSVELDRVELGELTLGDGLALGRVELDAGLSLLWRPRVHQLTLRGARLSLGAPARELLTRLACPARPGGGALPLEALPFEIVRIAGGVVTVGGVDIAVWGTLAPSARGIAVDLEASAPAIRLGRLGLRDLRATLRDAGAGLRACATGELAGAALGAAPGPTLEACATLPAIDQLGALRTADTTWRAEAPGWQLHGHGTLGWVRTLELTGGHFDASAASLVAGPATLAGLRLAADLAGSLSSAGALAVEVSGVARADQVELREGDTTTTAAGLQLPVIVQLALVDGELSMTPHQPVVATAHDAIVRTADTRIELAGPVLTAFGAGRAIPIDGRLLVARPLRWSAASARVGAARLQAPSGALIAHRTLRWRATEAEWRGARFREPAGQVELGAEHRHTTTWAAIHGPGPVELGPGEIWFHCARGRWMLDHGRSAALGGELTIDPSAGPPSAGPSAGHPASQPTGELVLRARGLDLHRVLAWFAHGHADGTGLLDGELAIRLGDAGLWVTRGALQARHAGNLRLSDPAWRARASASATGFALHQRIAATLSDFEYAHLTAVLHPAGADPELQVTTQGRGKRVAQELDLVINLRGVRDVARRLPFAQPPRSKP